MSQGSRGCLPSASLIKGVPTPINSSASVRLCKYAKKHTKLLSNIKMSKWHCVNMKTNFHKFFYRNGNEPSAWSTQYNKYLLYVIKVKWCANIISMSPGGKLEAYFLIVIFRKIARRRFFVYNFVIFVVVFQSILDYANIISNVSRGQIQSTLILLIFGLVIMKTFLRQYLYFQN